MIMHSPPSGESVARGSMLGEQVQLSPGHPEFFLHPLQVLLNVRSHFTLPSLL